MKLWKKLAGTPKKDSRMFLVKIHGKQAFSRKNSTFIEEENNAEKEIHNFG